MIKKIFSLVIAAIIIGAFVAAAAYAVGHLFDMPYLYEDGQAIVLGLSGATAGIIGPPTAALISRLFSRKS